MPRRGKDFYPEEFVMRNYDNQRNGSGRDRSRSPGPVSGHGRYSSRSPSGAGSRSLAPLRKSGSGKEPADLWDYSVAQPQAQLSSQPAYSLHSGGSNGGGGGGGVQYSSQNYNYLSSSGLYEDFPSSAPPAPPPGCTWGASASAGPARPEPVPLPAGSAPPPQASLQLPPPLPPSHKEAAIESEVRAQRATLCRQREEMVRKGNALRRELATLRRQRTDLLPDPRRPPSPDTRRFLHENDKLQLEIQNKLKTIENVIDMLNNIIGEESKGEGGGGGGGRPRSRSRSHSRSRSRSRSQARARARTRSHSRAHSHSRARPHAHRASRSPESGSAAAAAAAPGGDKVKGKFNYVYYDPEMHWCRPCNEFPPTAKDYLTHLHSAHHHKASAGQTEAPWHAAGGRAQDPLPSHPGAPTKRTPIKGLQFFVSCTAWYCKLCDCFIGDLHCASAHLKSAMHADNFANFVEQNPHWETDWMSDRQKAFEKKTKRQLAAMTPAAPAAPQSNAAVAPAAKAYEAHTITFSRDGGMSKRSKGSPAASADDKKKRKKDKKKKKRQRSSSSSESDAAHTRYRGREAGGDSERGARQSTRHSATPAEERKRGKAKEYYLQGKEQPKPQPRDKEAGKKGGAQRGERGGEEGAGGKRARPSPPTSNAAQRADKKMPFIGKMPVFKTLNKTAKEAKEAIEVRKKEEEEREKEKQELIQKKRLEIEAEIQKKVTSFKEKIASMSEGAGMGVSAGAGMGAGVGGGGLGVGAGMGVTPNAALPPGLALPTQLGVAASAPPPPMAMMPLYSQPPPAMPLAPMVPPAPPLAPPPPAMAAPPAPGAPGDKQLHHDFQQALDIIFPSEKKSEQAGGAGSGVPVPGSSSAVAPPLLIPGFEYGPPPHLYAPQAQLYDAQVPQEVGAGSGGVGGRSAQQLEELALLGIDTSDVGAL